MNTALPLLVIGLFFGGGIGFTIAAANGITLGGDDQSTHSAAGHGGAGHGGDDQGAMGQGAMGQGEFLSLPPSATAPTLVVTITEDPTSGFHLPIVTQSFTLVPDRPRPAPLGREGHPPPPLPI